MMLVLVLVLLVVVVVLVCGVLLLRWYWAVSCAAGTAGGDLVSPLLLLRCGARRTTSRGTRASRW